MAEERGADSEPAAGEWPPRPRALPASEFPEEPAPRRLHRARHERVIGGVCGGIAHATGLDPSLVRGLAVTSCLIGGVGLLGYPLALVLVPLEPRLRARPRADGVPAPDPGLLAVALGLLVLGTLALAQLELAHLSLLTLRSGALWPAVVLALALAALARTRAREAGALSGRPLTRPRRDRLVLGVASGFARHARVDVSVARLVLVLLAVWSHGTVLLVYLLLACVLPVEPRRR